MDVSELVSQMQDTLATIHDTLQSLDPKVHDAKLDELERKRDDTIKALTAAFSAEADDLERKRKAEREEIAEQRRKEDEERDRRRHEEDEQLTAKDHEQDQARDRKLKEDTEDVEQKTDELMSRVEEEARTAATEGRQKLQELQEKRRVCAISLGHIQPNSNSSLIGTQPSHRGTTGDDTSHAPCYAD